MNERLDHIFLATTGRLHYKGVMSSLKAPQEIAPDPDTIVLGQSSRMQIGLKAITHKRNAAAHSKELTALWQKVIDLTHDESTTVGQMAQALHRAEQMFLNVNTSKNGHERLLESIREMCQAMQKDIAATLRMINR